MDNQETAALAGAGDNAFSSVDAAIEHMEKQNAAADRQEQAEQTAKSEEGKGEVAADPEVDESDLAALDDDAGESAQDDDNGDISLKGDATAILRDGRKVTVSDLKKAFGDLETIRADQDKFAATKQEFETRSAQFAQRERSLNAVLPVVLEVLKTQIGEPPPLSMVEEHSPDFDPITYHNQKALFDARKLAFEQKVVAFQQREQEQQREQFAQTQEYLKGEHKLAIETIPEIATKEGAEKFYATLTADLKKHYGFEKGHVDQVADHRLLLMAKDAIRWRNLQAKKMETLRAAKAGNPTAPVLSPTRRLSSAERSAESRQGLLAKARESGSLDDVLSAFSASG